MTVPSFIEAAEVAEMYENCMVYLAQAFRDDVLRRIGRQTRAAPTPGRRSRVAHSWHGLSHISFLLRPVCLRRSS